MSNCMVHSDRSYREEMARQQEEQPDEADNQESDTAE